MPIRRELYDPNWEAISNRIRFDRAGGRCEACGVEHGAVGARDANGQGGRRRKSRRWPRLRWASCIPTWPIER